MPIGIGLAIRTRAPEFAGRFEEPGKLISSIVLAVIILGLVIQNWDTIVDEAP